MTEIDEFPKFTTFRFLVCSTASQRLLDKNITNFNERGYIDATIYKLNTNIGTEFNLLYEE